MSPSRYTLGIDIGGTKTAAAVIGRPGEVIGFTEAPTPATAGPNAVIDVAVAVAQRAIDAAPDRPDACGIGTAGTVNAAGVVAHATDALPGWRGTDLTERFTQALDLPVAVLNDVHAMALGEARYGAAAGAGLAVVVAIGTGIGGAIVHGGGVIIGASGSAGSIGHATVNAPTPRQCTCGRWNHLEAYAAGPAIEADYAESTGMAIRLPEIAARARAGDARAGAVIAEAAELLGHALLQVVTIVDPDTIVLTGGVAALGDLIGDPIRTIIATQALPGPNQAHLRFSTLGTYATILGAASAARVEPLAANDKEGGAPLAGAPAP
jgi:glucokinase